MDTAVPVLLVTVDKTVQLLILVLALHARMEQPVPTLPMDTLVCVLSDTVEEIVMLQLVNDVQTPLVKMAEPVL